MFLSRFLEHVKLHINLKSNARRGDLSIMLRSPSDTVSVLLAPRPFDDIRTGLDLFAKWPMMSVHFWGEPVSKEDNGKWFLFVRNGGDRPAVLNDFQITFHGTREDPQPGKPVVVESKRPSKPKTTQITPISASSFADVNFDDFPDFESGPVTLPPDVTVSTTTSKATTTTSASTTTTTTTSTTTTTTTAKPEKLVEDVDADLDTLVAPVVPDEVFPAAALDALVTLEGRELEDALEDEEEEFEEEEEEATE